MSHVAELLIPPTATCRLGWLGGTIEVQTKPSRARARFVGALRVGFLGFVVLSATVERTGASPKLNDRAVGGTGISAYFDAPAQWWFPWGPTAQGDADSWFDRLKARLLGTGELQETPGPSFIASASDKSELADADVSLKQVISTGLDDYLRLSPVQTLIGLELTADILTCCNIIANEQGIEAKFLSRAAGALAEVEWRPDWRDRILRVLALVEANRGNVKVAVNYLTNIKNLTEQGYAAFGVAESAYRHGKKEVFEAITAEWLNRAATAPQAQRDWIKYGVARVFVRVGLVDAGQDIVGEVFGKDAVPNENFVGDYYRALADALVRDGQGAEALQAISRAKQTRLNEFFDELVRTNNSDDLATAVVEEITSRAASLRPDLAPIYYLSESLTRLGEPEAALAVKGRRFLARDAIALGVVSGLIKSGKAQAARDLSETDSGPRFEKLFDIPDAWLQAKAVEVYAQLQLGIVEYTHDHSELDEHLTLVARAARPGAPSLALYGVYAMHNESSRKDALFDGVSELSALKWDVAAGHFEEAARVVLRLPSGLKRGVMLLQLAEAEVRLRQRRAMKASPYPAANALQGE